MKQVWQSNDGKKLGTKAEVQEYEHIKNNPQYERIAKVKASYGVQDVLKKFSLDTVGFWEIREEDPNCDFGGHHHNPYMATLSCTLAEAIEFAAGSPRFFGWGAGGTITKIEITNLK